MPIFAKKVSNMSDFNSFMQEFGAIDRAIYFTNTEEPPRYFKGLTSFFKDKLEFAYVTINATDVQEYLGQPSRPRWMVLKKQGKVKFDKRNYIGKRSFSDLRTYLSVFAHKKGLDRRAINYKKLLRERMSHTGSSLEAQDFDMTNFWANIDYEDEIVVLHITDALSLDYPNWKTIQKHMG